MLFERTLETEDEDYGAKSYWLASNMVDVYLKYDGSSCAYFSLGMVNDRVRSTGLFYLDSDCSDASYAVRPVVILKSGVTVNDLHKIADQTEAEWLTIVPQ